MNTIPEITDKVYAMGKAIAFKLGMKQLKRNGTAKKRANRGNRRKQELKEIKELRQWITRTSNELFRRKVRRKATQKEKETLKQLKVQMGKERTSSNWKNVSKRERESKITSSSIVTKKVAFSKHLKETRPKKEKCLRLRNSSNFGVVFGRRKEHQICPGWRR